MTFPYELDLVLNGNSFIIFNQGIESYQDHFT